MAPKATSVVLAVNLVSAPVMIALRIFPRTANVARMVRPVRATQRVNAALAVITAVSETTFAALVARRPSELATAILEAFR